MPSSVVCSDLRLTYADDPGASQVRADDARDVVDWLDWRCHRVPRPRWARPDQSECPDGSWRVPGHGACGLAHARAPRIRVACHRARDVTGNDMGPVPALLGGLQ